MASRGGVLVVIIGPCSCKRAAQCCPRTYVGRLQSESKGQCLQGLRCRRADCNRTAISRPEPTAEPAWTFVAAVLDLLIEADSDHLHLKYGAQRTRNVRATYAQRMAAWAQRIRVVGATCAQLWRNIAQRCATLRPDALGQPCAHRTPFASVRFGSLWFAFRFAFALI